MKRIAVILLIYHLLGSAWAQEKSIELPHVSITGKVEKPGHPLDSLLSFHAAQSATQVLGLNPEVSLKNYGPGNSASLSIRGTAASHSNIIWKGMTLANPMLAMNDLSILPGQLLGGARLICGGPSVSGFSGNFGGIILLDTRPNPQHTGYSLGSSAGSFGDFQQWGSAQGHWGKATFSLKTWHQEARNNFDYQWNEEQKTQFHARQSQLGVISEWAVPISPKWQWRPAIWLQNGNRELPPAVFEHQADARQQDRQLRLANEWQYNGDKATWELSQSYAQQQLDYFSPQAGIDSRNLSYEHQLRVGHKRDFKQVRLEGQFLQKYTEVISNNYDEKARQWQSDLLTAATWQPGAGPFQVKMQLQTLGFAYSGGQKRGIWVLPGLELGYNSSLLGQFRAGIFRKARIPGLNDLFWQNVGNPNLLPENGWSTEGNWLWSKSLTKRLRFQSGASVFASRISDYIQWLPVSGHWSPDNVTAVEIKGFHFQPGLNFTLGHWRIQGFTGVQYTSSVQRKARFDGDAGQGKQMMYVPRWNRVYGLEMQWKMVVFSYWMEHLGLRYTDPANDGFLPSYCLVNSRISSTAIRSKNWAFEGFFEGRNLTGISFQSVRGYPMPRQQFKLGIQISIHTKQ